MSATTQTRSSFTPRVQSDPFVANGYTAAQERTIPARPARKLAPPLLYIYEDIERQYRGQIFRVIGRILEVILPFLGLMIWVGWDRLWRSEEKNRTRYAIRLRDILTNLGPTSIKIGQALSTRPDLVSPAFLEELTKLQDELPPFDNQIAFALIEEELGQQPTAIYKDFNPQPVAAASLGQVYQAYLQTGEKVAIKVQRPNLVDRISLDIYIVHSLAAWGQKRFTQIRSDMVGIVDEFARTLYQEMDYVQEGQNAEQFVELYGYEEIRIPKIFWQHTGRRVLTMEWIDGIKLTQTEKLAAAGLDGRKLIEIGVNCSLRQLLENGFFHADPHPGNLLATYDGRLAYIDFGMMSTVEPHQRYGLLNAIVHLVNRDFQSLGYDYIELGFLTADTDLTPIVPALSQVFAEALGASVAELNFKSITDKLSAVMYDYPFRVPAYYALIIRSLVTLEGIAINLDPDFKVLSVAYPYVAGRLLSDPSTELRKTLRELLFREGEFRWNRLENLLRNAGNSRDFNLKDSLEKALDFIFSDRGEFLRERLVEVVFSRTQHGSSGMEHLQRVWDLLAQNPSFQPMELVPAFVKVATRPEAQTLGRELASRWFQREAAQFLRQMFVDDHLLPQASTNGRSNGHQQRLPQSV